MQQEQLEADIIAYSTVISSCAKSGQWEQALMFLGAMQANHGFSKFSDLPIFTRSVWCFLMFFACVPYFPMGYLLVEPWFIRPETTSRWGEDKNCRATWWRRTRSWMPLHRSSDGNVPWTFWKLLDVTRCGARAKWWLFVAGNHPVEIQFMCTILHLVDQTTSTRSWLRIMRNVTVNWCKIHIE